MQEALTNALRHGLDATARLCLDWRAQALAIEVSNPVSTQRPPAGGEGHGLVGIGERAALFHGRFRTQVLGGRHVVKVLLPYDGVSP